MRDGSPLVEVAPSPEPVAAPAEAGPLVERPTDLTGQVLEGRYAITRKLAEGGMSYVYAAHDTANDRSLAIKVLLPRLSRDPGSVERMRREAAIAMRFDHQNVCPILRLGETADGLLYLVMPFLDGEPLNDYETRRGPLPAEEGVPLLIQMCHGLQHAHDHGIVHRDLKPENVMLVPDSDERNSQRAVVMDFGLAKERRAAPEVVKLTQTGIVLGTPEFMSPEQIRGKPLDGRSDVYALAVLAFEMLTGQLPFSGATAQETMIARLRGQPMKLREARPDLPAKLEAVLARALALPAAERHGSMEEFAHALQSAMGGGVFGRWFRRS